MMTRLFYFIKPFIPRWVQLYFRRVVFLGKIRQCRPFWPIDQSSRNKPFWFNGWPGGKQFALVITHDVELQRGFAKISILRTIDRMLDFRSSFGLIPERYTLDDGILDVLRNEDNEIYVHDLYHDGRLFSSYETFHERAPIINHYLHIWNAKGFRAGAMHHNLDWIGELDIEYDMSTFDTDPFEPMPDGVHTIFPFLAYSNSANRYYVEIPYTMPQDLMALVIHPARSIEIWIRKFDWIVEHQGMVSMNVHPDYISFGNETTGRNTYPVTSYRRFLSYINDHYRDIMWNPLPSEMSDFIFSQQADRHRRRLA